MHDDSSTFVVRSRTQFAQVPRWIIRSGKNLSNGARSLYADIMSYADNDKRSAFPSQQTLADDLGVSERSIRTYMKELEDFKALEVIRRRNKRTGNFYANHYVLVWDNPHDAVESPSEADCRRREEADFLITTPTSLTTPTGSTSKQSSEVDVAPPIKDQGRRDTTKAENADPISPAFYHSKDREVLITNVQMIAQRKTEHDPHGPEVDEAVYHFEQKLMVAFDEDDDVIGWMITDRDWTPPKNATSRLKAAIWLNKLLNEWRNESGTLTWRGDSHGLAA